MLAGGGAEMLEDACFNMPTLGSLYEFAVFDAYGSADSKFQRKKGPLYDS
jgi:hypothetical protein